MSEIGRPLLQWGRACEDADSASSLGVCLAMTTLQWGRACEDADSRGDWEAAWGAIQLQWGRACEDADRRSAMPLPPVPECFNGAAPVRTRIVKRNTLTTYLSLLLQWGRACEDADRNFSAWERRYSRLLQWGRACEDADREQKQTTYPYTDRFNGAAPVRTRIGASGTGGMVQHPCFNGAAPVRTRIAPYADLPLALDGGFNGAAPVRTRIEGQPYHRYPAPCASMGPRL